MNEHDHTLMTKMNKDVLKEWGFNWRFYTDSIPQKQNSDSIRSSGFKTNTGTNMMPSTGNFHRKPGIVNTVKIAFIPLNLMLQKWLGSV